MASANVAAVLIEVSNALVAIGPQIVGLESLANDNLSEGAKLSINGELDRRKAIRDKYIRLIEALEALDADFPDVPAASVSDEVFNELAQRQQAVINAVSGFALQEPPPQADLDLSDPIEK